MLFNYQTYLIYASLYFSFHLIDITSPLRAASQCSSFTPALFLGYHGRKTGFIIGHLLMLSASNAFVTQNT